MQFEQRVAGSIKHDSTVGEAVDTNVAQAVASRAIATGKTGKLFYASLTYGSGSATIQLQLVRGGVTTVIRTDTSDWEKDFGWGLNLTSGDVIRLMVTGTGAGNADGLLSVEEYD